MTKYRRFILLNCFLIIGCSVNSQTSVHYTYDNAGNRTSRTVSVGGGSQKSLSIYDPNTGKVKDEKNLKSLEEKLGDMTITVYPNPNRGQMVVKVENLPAGAATELKVYNTAGKLVFSKKPLLPYTDVDITGAPPGTYIMKIFIGKDESVWKVIKK